MHICIYVCGQICMCLCMYIYVCVATHAYICMSMDVSHSVFYMYQVDFLKNRTQILIKRQAFTRSLSWLLLV